MIQLTLFFFNMLYLFLCQKKEYDSLLYYQIFKKDHFIQELKNHEIKSLNMTRIKKMLEEHYINFLYTIVDEDGETLFRFKILLDEYMKNY